MEVPMDRVLYYDAEFSLFTFNPIKRKLSTWMEADIVLFWCILMYIRIYLETYGFGVKFHQTK